ncbi:MAG: hypothetical protein M1819_002411 [Sarea resinae]|nr:MAG: hypothetical protein M1819_002411 [Sarea resinae]
MNADSDSQSLVHHSSKLHHHRLDDRLSTPFRSHESARLVDPPTMADQPGHRRRRSLMMNGDLVTEDRPPNKNVRWQPSSDGHINEAAEYKHSTDGYASDHSASTSDDLELDHLSEDASPDDEELALTGKDRRKRRRRKRRHTRLDERVAETKTTQDERRLADQSVLKASLVNSVLIGMWYLFSLSISIYNKWMFSPDHLDFHFPLFTTCIHMLVQFLLSSLVLFFIPRFRPRHDSISHQHDDTHDQKPLMTRMFYLTRIGPCGAATGLDIGLGNMSLKFISLTFFTMCKSSALAFVLIFAFLFRLEQPSVKLVVIICAMTVGVIMMVAGETAFNALGFILILSSAFFSGFRWALTQILLLRNPATSNPFSSIFFLAPVMFLSLLVIALPVEGPRELFVGLANLTQARGTFTGIVILIFPGILAFLMTSSEFALLQRTSVVTLSICGIFKEVVTISAAGIVFHDPLTPINVSGLLVTIASIGAYNFLKIRKMRQDAQRDAHLAAQGGDEGYVPVESEEQTITTTTTAAAGGSPSTKPVDDLIIDSSKGPRRGRANTTGLIMAHRPSLSITPTGVVSDTNGPSSDNSARASPVPFAVPSAPPPIVERRSEADE